MRVMQNFCISPGALSFRCSRRGAPGIEGREGRSRGRAPLVPVKGLTAPAHLTGFGQVGALLNACAFGRPQRPFCCKSNFNSTNPEDVNHPDDAVALRLITHSIAESATAGKERAAREDVCVCIPQLV